VARSVTSFVSLALAQMLTDERWSNSFIVQAVRRALHECVVKSRSEESSLALGIEALVYSLEIELVHEGAEMWTMINCVKASRLTL
jgi:hypothetical protein